MEFLFGVNLAALLKAVGLAGLFAIVFAESGLFIGFFLPGDSLLFTAGFLASQDFFDITILIAGCFVAAILGDNVGYAFGKRIGPRIFQRPESLLFNPRHLERARRFYERYGGKTLVLARFMPVVRTFAPILAGVGVMRYRTFFIYNCVGAVLWAIGVPLAGYFLGSSVPGADRYLLPIAALIVALSILPPLIELLRDRERRAWFWQFVRTNIVIRRAVGAVLVVIGIAALFIPFFPFAWEAFVGLQFLGLRLMFFRRLRSWWRGPTSHADR